LPAKLSRRHKLSGRATVAGFSVLIERHKVRNSRAAVLTSLSILLTVVLGHHDRARDSQLDFNLRRSDSSEQMQNNLVVTDEEVLLGTHALGNGSRLSK
jgi:hypothetical protein